MRQFIYATLFCLFMLFSANNTNAQQLIYQYGFENWTGDRYTTADYPFSSISYCFRHDECSEVVTSYHGVGEVNWTPHTGNYFLLRNDNNNIRLNPLVAGITGGHVNDNGAIGFNGASCSTNDLENCPDIETGQIFIRFWARITGFAPTYPVTSGCKWFRIAGLTEDCRLTPPIPPGAAGDSGIVFYLTCHNGNSPRLKITCADEGWEGHSHYLPSSSAYGFLTDAFDGEWHKFSVYVNWNTGTIRFWYDVEVETIENAFADWTAGDGRIGQGRRPGLCIIQGNFSAAFPTQIAYHAVDDIEIWDGFPGGDNSLPPNIPDEVTIVSVD